MKKLLTLCLVIILSLSFVACGSKEAAGDDASGVRSVTVAGHNGDVTVNVTMEEGKIVAIELADHEETEGLYNLVEEVVIPAIIENQGTDGVDAVAGATVTSEAVIKAVNEAVAQ